jgi:hypothetical protein
MVFQAARVVVICKSFPLMLKAMVWFSSLPLDSIAWWKELKDKFILNFTSCKQQFKTEQKWEAAQRELFELYPTHYTTS